MSEPLEAIARRCFEREEDRRRADRKAWQLRLARGWAAAGGDAGDLAETIGLGWFLLKFGGLWLLLGSLLDSGLLGFSSALVILGIMRVLPARNRVSRRLAAFRGGDLDATEAVYRFAVEEFRGQIERHRARTLGSGSEWGAARAELGRAVDGADRSMAYWGARLSQDPDNRMAARQLRTATELSAKLGSALAKLDGRADVLRKFYNDCEARIAVMDRCNRDIEETRRLEQLSGTADMVIAGADTALAGIGASFVREAHKMGRVLGSFERLQLKSLAGEAPLDDIEFLADRINEASEREYDTVERLGRTMGRLSEPVEP